VPVVAAFDPGRNVGFALVAEDGRLLRQAVLELVDVATVPLPEDAQVIVGDGTGRGDVERLLRARGRPPQRVDEVGTSEEGRELWRRHVAPRGLARLLPRGLRAPAGPIDDYAAWAIALRYLRNRRSPG
jgi:hypothetical protein